MQFVTTWGAPVALTVAIWLFVYAVRRWTPSLWKVSTLLALRNWLVKVLPNEAVGDVLALWKAVQMLPSVALGALVLALQTGGNPDAMVKGAIAGALAPVLHTFLKWIPQIPYVGKLGKRVSVPATLTLVCIASLGLGACQVWKPAARTVNDVARDLCALFFAEQQGISVEQAAKLACETREQLDPWIEQVLAAKQTAGAAATRK
jgi:hypothetical protein